MSFSILRKHSQLLCHCLFGRFKVYGLTQKPDFSGAPLVCTKNSSHGLRPACAYKPVEAKNLTSSYLKADILHLGRAHKVRNLHNNLTWLHISFRKHLCQFPSNHLAHKLILVNLRRCNAVDKASILHHCDFVTDLKYLLQPVRDINNAYAIFLQLF